MRSVAAGITTALAAGHVVLVTLVKIELPSGTVALNSSTWNLMFDGTTYLGAYGLGAIAPVTDQPGELAGLQLEFQRVDSTYLALALDAGDDVQGSPVSVYTAILSASTYQIIDAELDWVGAADQMRVSEDGETASVVLTCESKGVDLLRGSPLLYSDADQQAIQSGDSAFEYVAAQSDQPVVWPSREYFQR